MQRRIGELYSHFKKEDCQNKFLHVYLVICYYITITFAQNCREDHWHCPPFHEHNVRTELQEYAVGIELCTVALTSNAFSNLKKNYVHHCRIWRELCKACDWSKF